METIGDIALTIGVDDPASAGFSIDGDDLLRDGSLETAILISLFTDRRREDLPAGESDHGGCWSDSVTGDAVGSHLWTLRRENATPELPLKVVGCVKDALAWMVTDGVAQSVDARAWFGSEGVVRFSVEISRGDGSSVSFNFDYAWREQMLRRCC